MLPACMVIAAVAVFAGISGATLLLPLFFLLFPHLGVPALTPAQDVGATLVLQIATFGLAVCRYPARRLVEWPAVAQVAAVSLPAAVIWSSSRPTTRCSRSSWSAITAGAGTLLSPLYGRPAPPIAGTSTDGTRVGLDDYRGRWVIANFFATWCPGCRAETPELARFVA